MSNRARELASRALVAAATAAVLLALVAGYARRAAFDSDQFANRASAALRDESVRSLVAERITDEVVLEAEGDLLAARPIIQSAASAIVGGRAFTSLFGAAVRDVHRTLFEGDANTLTLTVADAGTLLSVALQKLRPSLARDVESSGTVTLIRRDAGDLGASAARVAERVRGLALILLALAIVLVAGALATSTDRRRTVVQLGIGAACAGILLVVAYGVLRSLAVDAVEGPAEQAAAGAVWDAFLADLRTAAWILAGSGAVVAAAAASLIKPVDVREPLRRAGDRLAAEPRHPVLRALRGAGLVVLGIVVLLDRDAVLDLLAALLGVGLVYMGVVALLRLVYRPPEADAEHPRVRVARRRPVAGLVAACLIAGAVATFTAAGGTTTAAPRKGPCNGHDELCDRPFDQVTLPATHNSMSAPLPGWFSAEHEQPIAGQLADGVRGLLIDTHYADLLPSGRVRTFFARDPDGGAGRDGVSPEAAAAARRTRDRLGFAGEGERGMYLCHSFCELGATPLSSVLDDLRDFLVANPEEVVVIINQDDVTPEDFVAAVTDAGLDDFAYRGPVDGDWPTLRQMIDADERVVFLAENRAGAAPWYHLAYERVTQETPYAFAKATQLTEPAGVAATCKPNRGPDGAPLFLANHWVTTDPLPRPSDAEKVNAYEPLLARMRACRRIRGRLPNLVAVNFHRRGDLFRVVDTLNGVR